MTTNLLGTTAEDVMTAIFDDSPSELLLVNPAESIIEELVETAATFDGDLPNVRLLARERALKNVMGDFIIASNAADLIESGHLALRQTSEMPQNALIVTDERVITLVEAGDQVGGLVASDAEFVAAANDAYGDDWDAAEEYTLRTPPISRVRATLEENIGEDSKADFDAVLASLETARGGGDGLDEVTISLLVAAKNRVLLYDISKWGEDVGIASKATFSRTKTRLEDIGLIDTEKVPIDVGRPRLRLRLSDDRLQEAEAGNLASVAQSVLAA